jgi:hypothetical protein
VINVFAREITDDLASLVKEIDKAVGENESKRMAAFVVLLTDDPDAAEPKLKELAKKHGIKNVPLTVFDGVSGPPRYRIAQDAEVTVLMWRQLNVKANHAFGKGQFSKDDVAKVMADTKTILE